MFALAALMLAATAAPAAPAYEPSFDPSRLKQTVAGEPGQALVLGSPHLSGFPKDFDAKALDPLLARLAAWQPQIVTIEGLSGPDCEMLLRYKPIYPGVYDDYCWSPEPASPPRRSAGISPRFSWPAASRHRRWSNGCACPRPNGARATGSMRCWPNG